MNGCSSCMRKVGDKRGCIASVPWAPVPFPGWDAYGTDEPKGTPCRCGTPVGKLHHNGCDMEECGRCGEQAISCGCIEVVANLIHCVEVFCAPTMNAAANVNGGRDKRIWKPRAVTRVDVIVRPIYSPRKKS